MKTGPERLFGDVKSKKIVITNKFLFPLKTKFSTGPHKDRRTVFIGCLYEKKRVCEQLLINISKLNQPLDFIRMARMHTHTFTRATLLK